MVSYILHRVGVLYKTITHHNDKGNIDVWINSTTHDKLILDMEAIAQTMNVGNCYVWQTDWYRQKKYVECAFYCNMREKYESVAERTR